MSQNASSSRLSGSLPRCWGLLLTSAAPPPAAAPKTPSRLFDLNKGVASANDCFDEKVSAVAAAASAEKVSERVLGEGALGKVEVMSGEGRGDTELAPSSEGDYDGEDTEEKRRDRALEDEAWATNCSLYDCMDAYAVQRLHATSRPTTSRGASAASTATAAASTASAAAAAAAPTCPNPASPAAVDVPAAVIAATAAVAATCGNSATASTTSLCRHPDRMVHAIGGASDGALAVASKDYARPSSWCECTADVEVTAAPSAAVEAVCAISGGPTAFATAIFRSLPSTYLNFCIVGRAQPNACTAAALLATSSATAVAAATATAAAAAPAAAPSVGSPISITAAKNDCLQQRLLHPVKYAGEGTCFSSEAQEHPLPKASHRGIAARRHLLQRGRIDSVFRSAAATPTTSGAAGSGCVAGSAMSRPSAQSLGLATPSPFSGNGFCHSADPLSQTFPQQTPFVPSTLSSRASQKRKNEAETLLRRHSNTEALSLRLLQASDGFINVVEMLKSGDAAKVLRSGEASEGGCRTLCADALRSRCPTDGFEGHMCQECGKVFNNAQALGGHISSHVRLKYSNFFSELGHGPDTQRKPLIESSSSIKTEPVATAAFHSTHDKESSSSLLYGAAHTSRGNGNRARPISFVGSASSKSNSNCSTADVLHCSKASLGQRHGIGSSSSCSKLNQANQPSAQMTGQQQGGTAQGQPCHETLVHVSQDSVKMCLRRSGLTRDNAAAATKPIISADLADIAFPHSNLQMPPAHAMPDKTSHGARAVQPYDPDFRAVTSCGTSLSVASVAAAAAPLTPSALTAAAHAFMAQREGDDERPSQRHRRKQSSSPVGAASRTHGGRATCESRAALGAAAVPCVHAPQLGSHSGSDFRPASHTALSLAGIHQQCLQGFLGCKSSQPAVDSAGAEVPIPEAGDNTPGLDLKLGL